MLDDLLTSFFRSVHWYGVQGCFETSLRLKALLAKSVGAVRRTESIEGVQISVTERRYLHRDLAGRGVAIDSRLPISQFSLDTFFQKKVSEKKDVGISLKLGLCSLLLLLFASFSCKDSPSASDSAKVTLTFEDASCIEAWLRLKVENATPPYSVALSRDGNTLAALNILTSDTLLIDEGLSPSTTYTYRASLTLDNNIVVQSSDAPARTLDTTSHSFTWQIDTLGVTSSVLYDCAIISEDNIWAVGELFLNDSSGQLDPILYNAAHWDGTQWNIIRIPYIYQGQTFYGALRAVFAFNANDVWFGSGNMIHWNGQSFASVELPAGVWGPYLMNKIWGHDGEIYVVGNSGAIAHRSAFGTWQRVESGTTLPIQDVFGARSNQSVGYQILCVAESYGNVGGSKILAIENNNAFGISTNGLLSGSLWAIWFVPSRKYIAVGDGVWQTRSIEQSWNRINSLPALFKTSIHGQGLNDVVVCGAFWLLVHFNGITWQSYFPMTSGSFTAVQIDDNLIAAVGGIGNKSVVAQGRRER